MPAVRVRILHDEVEHLVELNVGAVILTPGLETMPGDIRSRVWFWTFPQRGDQPAIRAHLIRLWTILRRRTATLGWKTPSQGGLDPVRRFA